MTQLDPTDWMGEKRVKIEREKEKGKEIGEILEWEDLTSL